MTQPQTQPQTVNMTMKKANPLTAAAMAFLKAVNQSRYHRPSNRFWESMVNEGLLIQTLETGRSGFVLTERGRVALKTGTIDYVVPARREPYDPFSRERFEIRFGDTFVNQPGLVPLDGGYAVLPPDPNSSEPFSLRLDPGATQAGKVEFSKGELRAILKSTSTSADDPEGQLLEKLAGALLTRTQAHPSEISSAFDQHQFNAAQTSAQLASAACLIQAQKDQIKALEDQILTLQAQVKEMEW